MNDQAATRPERSLKFPFLTLTITLLVTAGAVGALYHFSTARVEVTPNTLSAAVHGSFTATQSSGALPYEIITAEKIASQSVKSSGTKAVTGTASGTITIYNTQAKPQKLIATTRFATTAGLIFRIHAAATVPGGTAAKPGSVVARVYADKMGDTYNVAPTSFTVPGFSGTPQASQVYARSTAAMTGGASGTVPIIDAGVESQTRVALSSALASDLSTSIQGQIPAGYTLLPGAATTTFAALPSTLTATTGTVDVKEQGTITAVVFPSVALAKSIAASISALSYNGEALSLQPSSNVTLSATSLPTIDASSFIFQLTGTAAFVYTIDSTRIEAAVAGKTPSEAQVALTNYPEVKRAVLVLRPFWRQTFPQDPSAIAVTVANP